MKIEVNGNEKLKIILKDYWERSVNGFGSYSEKISKSTYNKHKKNVSSSLADYDYRLEFKDVGDSFYVFIIK